MKQFLRRIAALAACTPLLALAAYPERPINMIVAYSPGGGTDLVARGIVPYIEKYLGNNARIIVMNRPGAGGEIGFAALANSAPDVPTFAEQGMKIEMASLRYLGPAEFDRVFKQTEEEFRMLVDRDAVGR